MYFKNILVGLKSGIIIIMFVLPFDKSIFCYNPLASEIKLQ